MHQEEDINFLTKKENKNALALYIHIPFCKAKCNYCDFNSYAGREDDVPGYFDALKKEIELYKEKLQDFVFRTVFIGGGTPSLVSSKYIYDVFNLCKQRFNILHDAEVSIEVNPGTLSYEKLLSYKSMGINRLSIGLQAWQDRILKSLGRIHRVDEFVENYNLAKKVGFKNINIDLIFGLPVQTLNDWRETLKNVICLEPSHVSCYSLKIEDDTVFGRQLTVGELISPDDGLDRDMYYAAIDELCKHNYKHYEISNFSRPGFECKHNLVYWRGEQYIGLGAGAHSYFQGKRFNNILSLDRYSEAILNNKNIIENVDKIDYNEQISEFIILGLRLLDGINLSEFRQKFKKDIFELFGGKIKKLLKKDLLSIEGDKLMLTTSGLDFANQVFVEFI